MVSPSRIAARLRKIADSAATDASLSKVLRGLRRILTALDKGALEERVVLKGPFKPFTGENDRDVYEGQLWGLVIENDEFRKHVLAQMGITDPEEVKKYGDELLDEHTFHVEVDFSWSAPEPDVGWGGGAELSNWTFLALDGMDLTAEDEKAVMAHVEKAVEDQESGWAEEAAKNKAEADFDPPDDYDAYHDR